MMTPFEIDYDNLIYGEDGVSPIRGQIEAALKGAAEDDSQLRIEGRSHQDGTPSSRQEFQFTVIPTKATVESVMEAIKSKLESSPGPHFQGELRIVFSQAGHSQNRYATFSRRLPLGSAGPYMGRMGMGMGGGATMGGYPRGLDEGGPGPEEGAENSDDALPPSRGLPRYGMTDPGDYHRMGLVDPEDARRWVEIAFGMSFKAMAMQMTMFERACKMFEGLAMRYGALTPIEKGIVEHVGQQPPAGPGGLGILPLLLKAATQIAGSGDEARPPNGGGQGGGGQGGGGGGAANRKAAIEAAGGVVREMRRPPPPRRGGHRMAPFERPLPEEYEPPGDDGPDPQDDGGDEGQDFEPEEEYGHEDGPEPEDDGGGAAGYALERVGPQESAGGDFQSLSAEQIKAQLIQWVRADPSRKAEALKMLPDLADEFT